MYYSIQPVIVSKAEPITLPMGQAPVAMHDLPDSNRADYPCTKGHIPSMWTVQGCLLINLQQHTHKHKMNAKILILIFTGLHGLYAHPTNCTKVYVAQCH